MRRSWLALAACSVLAAPAGALAGVGAGDFEAGVSISVGQTELSVTSDYGSGDCENTTTTDLGTIAGNVGYFLTDIVELKAAASATHAGSESEYSGAGCAGLSNSGGSAQTFGVFSPGVDFVFLATTGKVAPFVGAAYGLTFGDTVGVDTDYIDVHGGAKFFIAERATIELKITRFEPTESAAGGRTELAAGINVYF